MLWSEYAHWHRPAYNLFLIQNSTTWGEKNLTYSASVPFVSSDPGPLHSCWVEGLFLSPLGDRRSKLEMKLTYHPSPQVSLQEAHYWKYLSFLELKHFFSYLSFHSLFCWFNVCFVLSQSVKPGWSVKFLVPWGFTCRVWKLGFGLFKPSQRQLKGAAV